MWLIVILLFSVVALAAAYVLLVRPILRKWAALNSFWTVADAFELGLWGRLRTLFEGLKIKLLARLVWVPTLVVGAYDKFTQLCASCDLTPVTAQLPAWVQSSLPLIATLAVPILIDWARSYSSRPAAD